MKYVFGVNKRVNSSKRQRDSKKNRKYYFCYEYSMENGKFKRVRISTIKAVYYKITFVLGLKSRMVGYTKDKKGSIYCQDCKKTYWAIVNFWNKDIDCPYC